jgi:hypothetical protein
LRYSELASWLSNLLDSLFRVRGPPYHGSLAHAETRSERRCLRLLPTKPPACAGLRHANNGESVPEPSASVLVSIFINQEVLMGFGRGALLWLLSVPLPIIILLALFWHH